MPAGRQPCTAAGGRCNAAAGCSESRGVRFEAVREGRTGCVHVRHHIEVRAVRVREPLVLLADKVAPLELEDVSLLEMDTPGGLRVDAPRHLDQVPLLVARDALCGIQTCATSADGSSLASQAGVRPRVRVMATGS
jgi:hypothetical protein